MRWQNPLNSTENIRGFAYEATRNLVNGLIPGQVYEVTNVNIRRATANSTGNPLEVQIEYNTAFNLVASDDHMPAEYNFADIGGELVVGNYILQFCRFHQSCGSGRMFGDQTDRLRRQP